MPKCEDKKTLNPKLNNSIVDTDNNQYPDYRVATTPDRLKKHSKGKYTINPDCIVNIQPATNGAPTIWTEEKALNLCNSILQWYRDDPNNIFTISYLNQHQILPQTVSYLIHKYKSFSETMRFCARIQEERLLKQAGEGYYHAGIAKLVLTTKHGYSDSVRSTTVDNREDTALQAWQERQQLLR